MIGVKQRLLMQQRRSPLVIEPVASGGGELGELTLINASALEAALLEHGALLFRGFRVQSLAEFDRFVHGCAAERLDYVYGSTPRTALGDRIFTATEYPPALEIPLHNENSYQREWPLKIALCCLQPAQSGGETPIADMQEVGAILGEKILDTFEARNVQYVRHYHPLIDVPWQKVFRTDDRQAVARFCLEHEIAHVWIDEDVLRTIQICQGVAYHPETRRRVFFNQAHLFHVSSLGEAAAKAMVRTFGVDRLPRQSFYGDGSAIPAEDLATVRAAFARASFSFPWQAGDVMLLDNMQFAHGRRPFKGPRKVLAALMGAHSAMSKAEAPQHNDGH